MKKTVCILALMVLACITSTCKKEIDQISQAKGKKGIGGKFPGGGLQRLSSIACGVSIGVTKDLQADFGAVGDGVADDSPAFLRAAQWINANWSPSSTIELYIPTGTYKVGVQLAPGGSYPYGTGTLNNSGGQVRKGFNLLELNNVQNVYIHGDPGLTSQIRYKNGLFFGGMTAPGSPCNNAPACNTCGAGAGNKFANVGDFISLFKCGCITIDNLSIDGNAQNCQLMGVFGECNGYEISYDAIDIQGGSDIEISNTDCINFGRDGLMVRYASGNPVNITLTDVNCISNCRQGFSFLAGDNLTATNCKFNTTGSIFQNNPSCGMDIEPDIGASCINSTFTSCEFKDNYFVGMITDGHLPYVSAITFSLCEFQASLPGSWSVWPNGMSTTRFSQCIIRGQFTHVTGGGVGDPITFDWCTITDFNSSFSNPISGWNGYLMNFGAGLPDNHFYDFGGCTFDIHHSLLVYNVASGLPSPYQDRTFEGNHFVFHYADMISTVSYYGTTLLGVGYNSSGLFQYPSLGNFISCYFVANDFTETAPVSTAPSGVVYWVGICLGSCGASYDNHSFPTNSFPQNGVGGNPYTRICYNPSWPSAYSWVRGTF